MGFNVDVVNGFFTLLPTLVLYAAYTIDFMPTVLAGMLGLILSCQWTYVTSVYWISFFVARRHRLITRSELYIYIGTMNAPWVLFALLGCYVSVRLIVDGNYRVLGYQTPATSGGAIRRNPPRLGHSPISTDITGEVIQSPKRSMLRKYNGMFELGV